MDRHKLLSILKSKRKAGGSQSEHVRRHAISILESSSTNDDAAAGTNLDLLNTVVKPLFSATKHPALSSTGRKNLVPPAPTASRFSGGFDDEETKPWKNGWTIHVLTFIIYSYEEVPGPAAKTTVESQFFLLTPPVLNLIDDYDIEYKMHGCRTLELLANTASRCRSDILKRSGLTDVFVAALKPSFMLLPTLTPEDESLSLMTKLYPAFRALVAASYPHLDKLTSDSHAPGSKEHMATPKVQDYSTQDARQSLLDIVMRHGILASYAHASEYIQISTFLLQQAALLVADMGIYSAKYLYQLLPLARNILSNPLGTASPPLLMAALDMMKTLIEVCRPRIRDVWWAECLRGLVACWMVFRDEDSKIQDAKGKAETEQKLQEITALLNSIVGDEFAAARVQLVEEEEQLEDLFSLATAFSTKG